MRKIITLDGPSCSGKGTLSRLIARKLEWLHIDSGLFYRAVACVYIEKGFSEISQSQLLQIEKVLSWTVEGSVILFYIEDRLLIESDLRSVHASKWASILAQQPLIRNFINPLIRTIADHAQSCVADGRDMASVVFPNARWKFYLTASLEVRAMRRWHQLKEQSLEQKLSEVKEHLKERA